MLGDPNDHTLAKDNGCEQLSDVMVETRNIFNCFNIRVGESGQKINYFKYSVKTIRNFCGCMCWNIPKIIVPNRLLDRCLDSCYFFLRHNEVWEIIYAKNAGKIFTLNTYMSLTCIFSGKVNQLENNIVDWIFGLNPPTKLL